MIYPFTLDSVFRWVPPKTQNWLDKPECFTHANVLLRYVHEIVFALKPAFLQDSCQSFYGPGQLTLCQCYLKMHVVAEGPGASLWVLGHLSLIQLSSVAQWSPTLCNPINRSMPGLPVHHQLPEFTQTHVHCVRDAIQTSHPRSSPSSPAPNPSQHQSLFQWVNSSLEVAKVLEFQL